MALYRSDTAVQALRTRCKSLSVQDRQILILANGRHSMDSLLDMVGEAARPAIVQLQQRGFLQQKFASAAETIEAAQAQSAQNALSSQKARGAAPTSFLPSSFLPSTLHSQLHSQQHSQPPAQSVSRPASQPAPQSSAVNSSNKASYSDSKRSRAAAKMYMLDMLGMIRSPESAGLRVQLQTAQDDLELAQALGNGLLFMRSQGSGSYAVKAAQQLQAITPKEILAALETKLFAK